MRIQHNIMAMNAYRNYNTNTSALAKNLEKLSSGYKINRAGDDAAGLAISEKMRAQITGLNAAQKNVKDGISLVKTAEGAMQEIQDMLNRMKYLATQSANGTYDDSVDRDNLQKEVNSLKSEINRIADSANFNGINLLDGSLGGGKMNAAGASFTGSEVAAYKAASYEATLADMSTGFQAKKDYFSIDGQQLEIDWENDTEAAKVYATLTAADMSSYTVDQLKPIAKDLENLLNNKIKEQGLSGSVTVSASATGKLKFESNNETYSSSVGFIGTSDTSPTKSIGAKLFASTAGESKVTEATELYNNREVTTADTFTMVINGVDVQVTGVAAKPTVGTTDGTAMSTVAGSLETAIQAAVNAYNTQLGLTAGTKDTASGLTGLTATDFTVKAEDGRFVISYSGDQDVNFSFKDVGDRKVASSLGLANGSSRSGGSGGLTLQIGDTADSFNQLNVSINDMHVNALGINSVDISSLTGAQNAIDVIKNAINSVSSTRGDLGAIQNRLEHTQKNLSVMAENIQDAESTIRDTDVAEEMMAYTKNNILIQSAQAMLAQANAVPQGVLQLLG